MAIIAAPAIALSLPASAQDLVVDRKYENFKRGNINSLDPKSRGLVVVWPDEGRVKMKASPLVVKTSSAYAGNSYEELKPGQTVDIHWYDYLDFLIAKTSPAVTTQADGMVKQGARISGLPGSEQAIRLFKMTGMVVRTDTAGGYVYIINASTGEPDAPSPDSGEIIRLPQIQSEKGRAALAGLKPGDNITAVFSVQTAMKVAIIR